MSDSAPDDLNPAMQESRSAGIAPVSAGMGPNDSPIQVSRPNAVADLPAETVIFRNLSAFQPQQRQFLRAGLAVMLVVLGVEWVIIATRRPDPLLLQRGSDYRTQFQVEINSATWIEWLQLEGIGQSIAHRIVADRKLNGPFSSIDDLNRVHGIGPATLDRIRPWLTMGHEQSDSRIENTGNESPSKQQSETEQRQQTSL